ncbi:MAG TPA: phosphoribosyltransferase family protein [Gemmatimonadaceae bacterium]|nr:phosphoribosyltransferase family protein [Gemmatimonadaceae bacterium]
MPPTPLYADRADAGRAVATALAAVGDVRRGRDLIVLGLPRGGIPVARAVADALGAPLEAVVARKLGVPGMSEVAFGAIAEGRRKVVEDSVWWYLGLPRRVVAPIVDRERTELRRRARLYRAGAPLPKLRGRTVVLVDDGLASGTTLRAAALAVRRHRPARVIAAVPVASAMHCDDVRATVDDLVTAATPEPFGMVSAWYDDFAPVSDARVLKLLGRSSGAHMFASAAPDTADEHEIAIPVGQDGTGERGQLIGDLGLPNGRPAGLVILAHGGGSSRNSYRNRYLAGRLRQGGWATLRIDLLLEHEKADDDITGDARFDIPRIARRLQCATEWAARTSVPGGERIVLFGASTGAAAALVVAATRPYLVRAVASRGGRVDLAGSSLAAVRAPVLMIVGGADTDTLEQTTVSVPRLAGRTRLAIIPGAGHTFDEPGALGAVGEHVVHWLGRLGRYH